MHRLSCAAQAHDKRCSGTALPARAHEFLRDTALSLVTSMGHTMCATPMPDLGSGVPAVGLRPSKPPGSAGIAQARCTEASVGQLVDIDLLQRPRQASSCRCPHVAHTFDLNTDAFGGPCHGLQRTALSAPAKTDMHRTMLHTRCLASVPDSTCCRPCLA